MDMITVDVTDVPNVEIGAPVELWGLNINITEIGLSTDASPYELLTRISPRVPRIYRQ
jgi:alanine racemase